MSADQVPIADARDELMGLAQAALNAAQWGVGITPTLLWQAGLEDRPPDGATPWVRLGLIHSPASGRAVGVGAPSEDGARLYHYFGQLYIQLFTPLGDGLSLSDAVSKVLVQALRRGRTPSGVATRNAVSQEAGREGTWYQTNVFADFEYYDRG